MLLNLLSAALSDAQVSSIDCKFVNYISGWM